MNIPEFLAATDWDGDAWLRLEAVSIEVARMIADVRPGAETQAAIGALRDAARGSRDDVRDWLDATRAVLVAARDARTDAVLIPELFASERRCVNLLKHLGEPNASYHMGGGEDDAARLLDYHGLVSITRVCDGVEAVSVTGKGIWWLGYWTRAT
jgi:hypothetical protein